MDLKEILGDLLTLEVNTIIKDGMTAHKMPVLPFALLDILHAYSGPLRAFGVDLQPYFAHDRPRRWLDLDKLAKDGDGKAKQLVSEAEGAYQTMQGQSIAAGDREKLFDYLTDLWPVLETPKLPTVQP